MSGSRVAVATLSASWEGRAAYIAGMSPPLTVGASGNGGVVDPWFTLLEFIIDDNHRCREGLEPLTPAGIANLDKDGEEGLVGALRLD